MNNCVVELRGEVRNIIKFMIENKISFSASTINGNLRMYFNDEVKASFDKNVPCPYTLLKEEDDFYFNEVIQFWLLGNNEEIDEVKKHFDSLTFFYLIKPIHKKVIILQK